MRTARAVSAGGVVLAELRPDALVALVAHRSVRGSLQWTLPKGAREEGETVTETALREVREETGMTGELIEQLGEVRYWYQRDGRKIPKLVTFFLFEYRSGSDADHDSEVEEVRWLPLEEAALQLSYKGEREMVRRALSR